MLDRFNKSSNPMARKFENSGPDFNGDLLDAPVMTSGDGTMTMEGSITKTIMLLALLVATAFTTAWYFPSRTLLYVGAGGAFVTSIALAFRQRYAPFLGPVYALFKGIAVGVISLYYSTLFDGIVIQAIGLTISTLFVMLLIYRSGLIPVTQRFRMIVASATMGIMLMYLVIFILNAAFGMDVSFLHDTGWLNIGLSLFIIAIASLNFLLDFDLIDRGVQHGAPKYMEWFAGYTLVFTLVWLYLEFLRLIAILSSND